MTRALDIFVAGIGLLVTAPILLPMMFLIWWQDRHSPLYIAPRVGLKGRSFRMIKLRSMVVNADKSGVDSTEATDNRITPVGHFIRKYKLDELVQFWNILLGDMSLVGPRPNVRRETDLYTTLEMRLLKVKPGITDFASIVFADEGDILNGEADPDLAYNQLIRPGKSRLGLFYIERQSILLNLQLCALTAIALFSRTLALSGVVRLLKRHGADKDLQELSLRTEPLVPLPPPGASGVVMSRCEL